MVATGIRVAFDDRLAAANTRVDFDALAHPQTIPVMHGRRKPT